MKQHTKGPWNIGTASGIKDHRTGQWIGEPTYPVFCNDAIEGSRGPSSVAHAKLADAALIAAAPEMLEALIAARDANEALHHLVTNEQERMKSIDALSQINKAINKARGGA